LSSLYFEIESSGGPIFANPLAMDQLSLVMSSGSLGLPHEEGACLSLSVHRKMNRSKIFCSDNSASFVLGKRKLRTSEERERAGIGCGRPRKLQARAASYLSSCTSAVVGLFQACCPLLDQVPA
jgi:hypothetical protein